MKLFSKQWGEQSTKP